MIYLLVFVKMIYTNTKAKHQKYCKRESERGMQVAVDCKTRARLEL